MPITAKFRTGLLAITIVSSCAFLYAPQLSAQVVSVQQPVVSQFGGSTIISVPDQGETFIGGVGRSYSSSIQPGYGFQPRAYGYETSGSSMPSRVWIHDFDEMDRQLLQQADAEAGASPYPYREIQRRRKTIRVMSSPANVAYRAYPMSPLFVPPQQNLPQYTFAPSGQNRLGLTSNTTSTSTSETESYGLDQLRQEMETRYGTASQKTAVNQQPVKSKPTFNQTSFPPSPITDPPPLELNTPVAPEPMYVPGPMQGKFPSAVDESRSVNAPITGRFPE
jgi:hypothetical protein